MSERVLLVTGCGAGFGRRVALRAARAGWVVYAGLRSEADGPGLEAEASGLKLFPVQLDVTKAEERRAALARIEAEHGRLDGLVNNAGRALGGFLELVEEDELRALFDLNVFAPWALTREAAPLLRAASQRDLSGGSAGRATVVMVSSTSGLTALPGLGAYASSKFALEGMSEAWRHELALFGVRVVLVEPGAYATDIIGRNRQISRGVASPGAYAPWVRSLQAFFEGTFAKIARDPEEVAEAIVGALSARRPPMRLALGPGAGLRSLFRRLLPFWLMDLVMARALAHVRRLGEREA